MYYGKARRLGWLPLRYGFVLLKHYYGLEAFLSFNARPVVTDRVREAALPRATASGPARYIELYRVVLLVAELRSQSLKKCRRQPEGPEDRCPVHREY